MSTQKDPALDAFWMPFTANRQFKDAPRMLQGASGMYYQSTDGRKILDGVAGLWCCNAGHGRQEIAEAVSRQISTLDFAPTFQMGHPLAFELADRLAEITPDGLNRVFFTNSGSESVDTALKIAMAYHRACGEGARTRFIGREKGYHGVGFGGISVGGMINNRKAFSAAMIPGVDHMPHTLDMRRNAFSKGLPEHGVELADELERICALHDPSTIAAVIIEPVSGSAGVIPPPQGYLQRIREICDRHKLLLIFDEVITGYGRVGDAFAAHRFGVTPDIITSAKGLTNGAVPMGAVFVRDDIHSALMRGPAETIELFHGYTYSGHPLAAAAGLATLDIYQNENLFDVAKRYHLVWEQAAHALADLPHVVDVRNYGLMAGIELAVRDSTPGARGYDVFTDCFHNRDLLVRASGDIIALSPPLIVNEDQIGQMFDTLAAAIRATH